MSGRVSMPVSHRYPIVLHSWAIESYEILPVNLFRERRIKCKFWVMGGMSKLCYDYGLHSQNKSKSSTKVL